MKKLKNIYEPPSLWLIEYSGTPPFTCGICNEPIATGEKYWRQFLGKRKGSRYFHFACEEKYLRGVTA